MKRTGFWLCAAGAAMAAWLCVSLYVGPARTPRGGPLPLDAVLLLAALAALLGAAGIALRKGPVALAVFLVGAGAPLANTRLIGSQDTEPAAQMLFSVVREGTLTIPGPATYAVPVRDGKFASRYPVATALIAVPIALPATAGRGALDLRFRSVVEKLCASVLSGVMLALLFLAQRRLTGTRVALAAAALTLFGTATLPILGQALWQHTGAALALAGGLAALGLVEGPRRSILVGFCAGVAVACRPPDLPLALGLLWLDRRRFVSAMAAAGPILLTLLYQAVMFGSALRTGYGAEATIGWRPPWPDGAIGSLGLWLSPGRGLAVCYPILVFGLAGLWWRRELRPLAVAIVAETALIGCWWAWEGGFCQGPRMLADATPFFGLGIAAVLQQASSWRRPARAALIAAAAVSCATAMALAYVYPSKESYALFGALRDGPWTPRAWPLIAYLSAK